MNVTDFKLISKKHPIPRRDCIVPDLWRDDPAEITGINQYIPALRLFQKLKVLHKKEFLLNWKRRGAKGAYLRTNQTFVLTA